MEINTPNDDTNITDWPEIFASEEQLITSFSLPAQTEYITGEAELNQHLLKQTLLQHVNPGQTKKLNEIWLSINNILHFN